jgi:uncharacterized membrane protein YfcA
MPISELTTLALALTAAGLVTGFLAGLLGVGGGAILVPVLYEVFTALGIDESVRMHMVLGTSLAVIVPTSLRSIQGHLAKGAVDTSIIRRLGPWVALGVVLGVATAKVASAPALKWVWVVAGSLMAAKMALGRDDWRLGDALPASKGVEVTATGIGIVSALMSIGGGMFVVSLLTLYCVPIHTAVATSSGFGPIISIPGALGFVWAGWDVPGRPPFSAGYVNLLGAGLIIPASLLAVPYGVAAAHAIPKRKLELAFAAFLACVAGRFLWSLI